MTKKIICISTARKNSQSVKNKNLIKIDNIPMLYHNIFNALKIKEIDVVALTTDIKIKKINDKKFTYVKRPKKLSHNKSSHKETIIDCLEKIEKKFNKKYDYIVLILGNSIGAKKTDLSKAIKKKLIKENFKTIYTGTKNKKMFVKKFKIDKYFINIFNNFSY